MQDSGGIEQVDPSEDTVFVRYRDADLPVRVCDVHWAKKHDWYDIGNANYRSALYAALRLVGLHVQTVKLDVKRLNLASRTLGLTPNQVRGAYGLAKGIFNRQGRFIAAEWHRKAIEKVEVVAPDCQLFDESNWPAVRRRAIEASRDLPLQVDIDVELRWISSRLIGCPDFTSAPSAVAVTVWCVLNDPVPSKAKIDYIKTYLSKRMATGEKKRKEPVFDEDVKSGITGDDEADAELMSRLFDDV